MRNPLTGLIRPTARPLSGPLSGPQRPMSVDVVPAGDHVLWKVDTGGMTIRSRLTAAEARQMAALFLAAAEAVDPTPEADDADGPDGIEYLVPECELSEAQAEMLADAMARVRDFPGAEAVRIQETPLSRIILPGREIARPAPPGVPPGAVPLEHLAEALARQGAESTIKVASLGGRVGIRADCGPLNIPLSFGPAEARKILEALAGAIADAEAAAAAAAMAAPSRAEDAVDAALDAIPAGLRLAVIPR